MKVFYITIDTMKIIEGDLQVENKSYPLAPTYHIIDKYGVNRHIIKSTKLYNTKEEVLIDLFIKNFKSFGIDQISKIFDIEESEAKIYWNKALDLFPEKFI